MTDPTTALHEVLALSNKERDAEENREYGAANDLYAELQVAAVNLVRTHGPALLSALERASTAEARAERLAEALRVMLGFYGGRVDAECRTKDLRELEAIEAARAALRDHDQEGKDG